MRRTLSLFATVAVSVTMALPAAAAPPADALDGASQTASATIGAPETGYTGNGVGVAVVDTGVSPMPTLGDQVAARVDVSGIGRNTDGHGHGTFLAGLIAGQEGPAGHRLGVAPDAHVVSVKVADAHGRTSLDRILAGLAAIRSAPAGLNIKVVVIAIGGPADDIADPIEEALEQMWADGYFVVVASGNTGGGLAEPGTSPYLMTVGAIDDAGTADAADDTVPTWSGAGVDRDGNTKPDVLAPGTSVVSTRIPGSTADQNNPDSRIDGHWFRGSGTSQAAAVAGGAAAVLYQAHPDLTPDQVKGRLVESARTVDGSPAGVVDLPAAMASDAVANTQLDPISTAEPVQPGDDAWNGNQGNGNQWNGKSWAGGQWNGYRWNDDIWIGKSWAGKSWAGKSWAGKSWAGKSWADLNWDGKSWAGQTWVDQEWAGKSWANDAWTGKSWAGKSWAGKSWAGGAWFGKSWAGDSWVTVDWFGRSWN